MFYFLSADYDEGDQTSYRGLRLRFPEGVTLPDHPDAVGVCFNSGDPVVDFIEYTKFDRPVPGPTMHSSSMDHFIMDGDVYTPCYVRFGKKGVKAFHSWASVRDLPDEERWAITERAGVMEYIGMPGIETIEAHKAYYQAHRIPEGTPPYRVLTAAGEAAEEAAAQA